MNIFVIWNGGREHAIVNKLTSEIVVTNIHVDGKNLGMKGDKIVRHWIDISNIGELISYIREQYINLVFIWPEQPLCEGVTDFLRSEDINVFGPSKDAAQLEGSKIFSYDFNHRHGIPQPTSFIYLTLEEAISSLKDIQSYPLVIKYPWLANGKGVTIAQDHNQAFEALQNCFNGFHDKYDSGSVIVQEFLTGIEMSAFFFIDTLSQTVRYFSSAQDHKKRYEESHEWDNPMTGGMGTVSPSGFEKDSEVMTQIHAIWKQFLQGLLVDNLLYQGVIFMGLIITSEGPRVIEYNVRFWDPETQAMISRMTSPLSVELMKIAQGKGNSLWTFEFSGKALNLVVTDIWYPHHISQKGNVISWIEKIQGAEVLYAWMKKDGDYVVANWWRVLNLLVTGNETFSDLNSRVLEEVQKITFWWEEPWYRNDIGEGKDG